MQKIFLVFAPREGKGGEGGRGAWWEVGEDDGDGEVDVDVDVDADVDVNVDFDMRWNGRIYMIDLERAHGHAFYALALRLVKRGVCWLPAEGILWDSFHGRWELVRDWWEALM